MPHFRSSIRSSISFDMDGRRLRVVGIKSVDLNKIIRGELLGGEIVDSI